MENGMKRSEVNRIVEDAISFVDKRGLKFPSFATWNLEKWRNFSESQKEIIDNI